MFDFKALNAQRSELITQARTMLAPYANQPAPEPVAQNAAALLGKADELKARIDMATRLETHEQDVKAGEVKAANLAWRESAPGEGAVEVDEKAWREIEVKTLFGTKRVRFNTPVATGVKGYAGSFESYLRRGIENVGPNDRKTLSAGVDTAGGFLVPDDYHVELIKKIATLSAVRSLARVATTSRDQAKWPRVNYTTDDKYTSGVRLTWTGETPSSATVHRVTDPVFGMFNIPVHTAMASMPLTMQLMEDSAFDVVSLSSDMLAEAFALGENDAFLNGNGVARPMGLLTQVDTANGPASVVSGTSAQIYTAADGWNGKRVNDLYYTVPAQYRGQSSWLMNSLTMKEVENLVDGQKRPLTRPLTGSSLEMGEPTVIKGRRVAIDEFVPDIGASSYPIIFGDFGGYLILDRVGFSVQRNDYLYMETDITLLIARKRVGGQVVEPYRLKVMKCSA